MGYICHHAIAVTTWDNDAIHRAHVEAQRLFYDRVSGVINSTINGYQSFFIAPDGSKEGWDSSDDGDRARDEFIGWLRAQAYQDGSSRYAWVEVQYGDDCHETTALRSSDADYSARLAEGGGVVWTAHTSTS